MENTITLCHIPVRLNTSQTHSLLSKNAKLHLTQVFFNCQIYSISHAELSFFAVSLGYLKTTSKTRPLWSEYRSMMLMVKLYLEGDINTTFIKDRCHQINIKLWSIFQVLYSACQGRSLRRRFHFIMQLKRIMTWCVTSLQKRCSYRNLNMDNTIKCRW